MPQQNYNPPPSGSTSSLTSTYIGFGDGSNLMTGDTDLTWDGTTLNVAGDASIVSGTSQLSITSPQFMLGDGNADGYAFIGGDYSTGGHLTLGVDGGTTQINLGVNSIASTIEGINLLVVSETYINIGENGSDQFIGVNKATGNIQIQGLTIDINGYISLGGVPEYANRTTAMGAGLTAGRLYSLPISGDNKVICIV